MSPVSMATVGAISKYPTAAVPWTPASLGGALQLWLDADDAASFTLSGSNVSQWNDKSGNGFHATQGTDTNRPTRETNVLNSRACVRFDGFDNRMSTGYSLNGVTSFATSVVVKADSVEGSQSILRQQPTITPYFVHPWTTTNTPRIIMSWDGTTSAVNLTGSLTSAATSGFVRVSGSTNKAFLNGTEQNSRAANSVAPTFTGTLQIGYAQTTGGEHFDGDLHEVVIYNGSLSSTDRERLEGYLAHKWGLTANLPSGHPYKSVAPTYVAPPAWTPTDLGGSLHVWFDADDATTFTEVSGLVSQWNDKSSNARNATQTTAGRRPARVANTLNSKTVVDFTSDLLLFSTSGLSQPYSYFVVFEQDVVATASGTSRVIHSSNGSGGLEALNGSSSYNLYHGTGYARGTTSAGAVRILHALFNTTASALRVNGTQQGTAGNVGTQATTTSWSLGAGQAYDNYLDGYIAEFVLVTGSITTTNIERAEGYLAHKWGLTSSLPAGHPYKSVAP